MLPQNTNAVFTKPVLSSSFVVRIMTRKRRTQRRYNVGNLSYRMIAFGSFTANDFYAEWWIWQVTVNTVNTILSHTIITFFRHHVSLRTYIVPCYRRHFLIYFYTRYIAFFSAFFFVLFLNERCHPRAAWICLNLYL